MSILLDALRKSERSKHKQSVPTIHTGDHASADPGSFRVGPVILLVTVALVVNGWLIWRQYRLPDTGYQPPVTLASESRPVAAVEPAETGVNEKPGAKPSGEVSAPAEKTDVTEQKPAALDSDVAKLSQRTPVESYSEPAPKPSSPDTDDTGAVNQMASTVQAPVTGGQQAVSQKPVSPPPATENKNITHQPAPIGYWELPDAVRANVPEIKFSVLVYAQSPENRFVLINGQRFREGDSLQAGLKVKEIRRDGVIFSYRLYQFLVER